jgi:hypothetical protein
MLKQPAYLYKNIQYLYTDLVAANTGYRKMYAKPMKIYKGIDNTFELKLLNGDQKPLNVVGYTVYWQMLDRETAELKYITNQTVVPSATSLIVLTIPAGDIEHINSGHYTYSTYLVSPAGVKTILYGDSQYGASVPVEVINNSFPQALPSQEVTEFIPSGQIDYVTPDTSLYTSALTARPELNSNDSMHTIQIYSIDFTGTVDVQATLENGVTDVVTWAVVETVDITDPLIYHNFKGVYSWIRFHIKPNLSNTGTVDKILYRS